MSDSTRTNGFALIPNGLVKLTPYLEERHLRWLIAGLSFVGSDRTNGFWPKQTTLAELAGHHRVWANRVANELKALGIINIADQFRQDGMQGSSRYVLADLDDPNVFKDVENLCREERQRAARSPRTKTRLKMLDRCNTVAITPGCNAQDITPGCNTQDVIADAGCNTQSVTPGVTQWPLHPVSHSSHYTGCNAVGTTAEETKEETTLRDQEKRPEGAAVPLASIPADAASQAEAVATPSNYNEELSGPQGQAGVTTTSDQNVSPTTTSIQMTPEQSTSPKATASTISTSTGDVGEQVRPRVRKSRRAKPIVDQAQKARVQTLACKSFEHMKEYLLHGADGVQAVEDGKDDAFLRSLAPTQINWRQYLDYDANGEPIMIDGNPSGIHKLTSQALAGYFWYCVCLFYSQRDIPLRLPDFGRLGRVMKQQVEAFNNIEMFDRCAAIGSHYDVIMSLRGKQHQLPGEDTFNNSLVSGAYAEWSALSKDGKEMLTWEVRNATKEAA